MTAKTSEVTLTKEECLELYNIINDLSGGNARNTFSEEEWAGDKNYWDDPATRAYVKLYLTAGQHHSVPSQYRELAR